RSERPTFEFEEQLWQQGKQLVAGLDEVGRGALAGPVVAAACVFAPGVVVPDELNDSKRLSPKRRQALVEWIRREAVAWAVGAASHREIDRFGIVRATLLAMTRALERLGPVDHVLYDGLPIPAFPFSAATAVVGGDCRSVSIAAASIVAKVVRDDVMRRVARRFPVYGWDENAGYGTAAHRSAIARCGLTPLHRRTFRGGGTGEET
ncbi:MAG: ribonuclease HII, partial [Thermomicrobium sp.]|nr:ribonuclease HII [Thermomicrobium sp.]